MESKPLTPEMCTRAGRDIREGAARLGVRLEGQHDLEKVARACDRLASLLADPPGSSGILEPDAHSVETFMMAEQGMRLASILRMAGRVDGSDKLAVWIKGRINRLETQAEEAQDHLFELDIAARLVRWIGQGVSIDEPDIVITIPAGRLALALKRPRSIPSVGSAIEKARKQIGRTGLKGMIVIGTEALFHHSNDPARPTVLYQVATDEDAEKEGRRIVKAAALQAKREIINACLRESGVGGILFFGALTYLCTDPEPAYGHRYITLNFPNKGYPGASDALEGLAGFLLDEPP